MGPTETKIQNIDYSELRLTTLIIRWSVLLLANIVVGLLNSYLFNTTIKKMSSGTELLSFYFLFVALVTIIPVISILVGAIQAVSIIYFVQTFRHRGILIKKFATKNNFEYYKKLKINNEPGLIFQYANKGSLMYFIKGKLGDNNFYNGKIKAVINFSKPQEYINFTSINLSSQHSRLILNSKNNSPLKNFDFKDYKKLEQTGDLQNYFNVYVSQSGELESYNLLTTSVKLFMIQNMSNYDIEIVDDKLYVYWDNKLVTPELYKTRFQLFAKLLDLINSKYPNNSETTTNFISASPSVNKSI